MGESDLQRLCQPCDTHTAQTQAHQATVQHAAVILQVELGALWREMGEARLQKRLSQLNCGKGSWEPPGPVVLAWRAKSETRGPEDQGVMGDTPGKLVTKPGTQQLSIAGLQTSPAILTGEAQGQKKSQPRNGGQWVPMGGEHLATPALRHTRVCM